jgi:O-antigen/teichoic acid export membrane protein
MGNSSRARGTVTLSPRVFPASAAGVRVLRCRAPADELAPNRLKGHPLVQFLSRVGVTRPVLYSVLARGMQGVAALVGIIMVGHFLDQTTQGYYFTILGFVVFVQLADFGLTYAVMQSASHEAVSDLPDRDRTTERGEGRQLLALLRGATRFNTAATFLAALVIFAVGTRVLVSGGPTQTPTEAEWWLPWVASVGMVGAAQLLNPRVSLLEGGGFVTGVWLFRLGQEIAAATALWAALALGWDLWAIALSYGGRAVIGVLWLNSGWRRVYFVALASRGPGKVQRGYWRTEVWPFQWRIGVSALSGYLIFQFFTPLMFALKGPAIAGQFGMTLTLTNGLLTVTTAWLNSQAPGFGKLIATRSYDQLDKEFAQSLQSSFIVVVIVGVAMLAGVVVLGSLRHPFAERLLPPTSFLFFVGATVVNHVVFARAIYLRAHRREPLLASSVAGAVLTPLVVVYAGRRGGVNTIAASYFALTTLGLCITAMIFTSRARAWHARSYS